MKHRAAGWQLFVFLAPAVLVYGAFSAWPLLDTLRLGLYTADETGRTSFAGLANFRALLSDPQFSGPFWNAFGNNVRFFIIHMLVQNPVALLLAALLSLKRVRGAAAYRTVFFLPTLLSVVIIGFSWQLILSPLWGVAESVLGFFGLEDHFQPWLGLEDTALTTLALISVWQFIGIPLMLIYAALIAIPEEIIEAATVEGAGPWRIFFEVRLPLILPTLGLVTILTFIGNFNAFDLIYAVKGGLAGPNYSTDILGTLFYRTFFGYQAQVGSPTMGAALATLMFFVILAGVAAYLLLVQRRLRRFAL
ncbi:carbohydrate ABC transporter permease [Pelomonas sp. KK5]|uniref:carbohydrate ABC transporter permease n=1 Tax=Pelomonas sp. KK5 TaxID=1855730 RepID=UPI00097C90B3|nr:sugar ABC transporter permease [Pelomonas sp. KK5]